MAGSSPCAAIPLTSPGFGSPTRSGADYCGTLRQGDGSGTVAVMDWSSWAGRLEHALGPEGDFPSFFAPGALFSDPVNQPTSDLAAIEEMTQGLVPRLATGDQLGPR